MQKVNYKKFIGDLGSLDSWQPFYKRLSKQENMEIKRVKWQKRNKKEEGQK